jgi:adenylate cyclase
LISSSPHWRVILKRLAVVIVAVLVTSLLLRTVPRPFDWASTGWWDLCQSAWPYDIQTPLVQVVDIDDSSLERVGGRPWSRQIMTTILDRLREAGAAVVGFDLKFDGPARDEPSATGAEIDARFAEAIGRLPTLVGFMMMTDARGNGEVIRKAKFAFAGASFNPADHLYNAPAATVDFTALQSAASGVGYANVVVDSDGHIRRMPLIAMLQGKPVPSFEAEVVRVAKGKSFYVGAGNRYGLDRVMIGDISVRTSQAGYVWLRYGHSRPEQFIHAADVVAGTFDRSRVAGRIVLVGVSAPSLGDQWPSPFGANMPGVEILAQSVEQILQGALLSRPSWMAGIEVLTAIVAAALVVAVSAAGRFWALAAGGALIVLLMMLSGLAYVRWQVLMNPIPPALTIAIAAAGAALLRGRRERQRIEA